MSYESKCFLFGELSFHFLSTAQSTSDPIIYRISYIKSPPWSMIGYKRRLSVCGSNCCGNAPRLDDPPSIHSHSQKTHTTDHRKRTRYHKLKQSPKKESHNMPQICVNKKYMPDKERHQSLMIKRAPRKTDSQNPSPRKQKPSKHKTYAQSFAIKVSNKTVQILRKK